MRSAVGLRFGANGEFAAPPENSLAPGQFIAGAVLNDRQQRRQDIYRKLLGGDLAEHLKNRNLLLAWAEPAEFPVVVPEGTRAIGNSLLIVPLQFEPSPRGSEVRIPEAFIPFRRVSDEGVRDATLESPYPIDMHLRFQIPPSATPLIVNHAILTARIRAPGWKVTLSGFDTGKLVPLRTVESPAEMIRISIDDPKLLRLDAGSGLHLNVALTNSTAVDKFEQRDRAGWKIESLGLEVTGRTAAKGAEHGN